MSSILAHFSQKYSNKSEGQGKKEEKRGFRGGFWGFVHGKHTSDPWATGVQNPFSGVQQARHARQFLALQEFRRGAAASSEQAPYPSLSPGGESSLTSLLLLSPPKPQCWVSAGTPAHRHRRLCADQASSRHATPGSSLPSRNSREAPPPVEI